MITAEQARQLSNAASIEDGVRHLLSVANKLIEDRARVGSRSAKIYLYSNKITTENAPAVARKLCDRLLSLGFNTSTDLTDYSVMISW